MRLSYGWGKVTVFVSTVCCPIKPSHYVYAHSALSFAFFLWQRGWYAAAAESREGSWKYFGSLIHDQHLAAVGLDWVAFIRVLPTQISWWFRKLISLNQNPNAHCQIQSFTQRLCFVLMCFKWGKDWTYPQELRPGPSQPNIMIWVFLCTIICKYWEGIPVCKT